MAAPVQAALEPAAAIECAKDSLFDAIVSGRDTLRYPLLPRQRLREIAAELGEMLDALRIEEAAYTRHGAVAQVLAFPEAR
ncbi:hypothetical protein JMM61_20845 [Rhodovulum sulfidophilum]|uniref:hypothetical protein n=1 Tax=Rhodovulum sulfidophilum TaxID=35806 RepID=UPI001928EE48|nr:hypothetical protein [Rhodovulum sulfidophilum]MBL3587761.1 hypothetical protein [Rhodovulum sulfidophilum]